MMKNKESKVILASNKILNNIASVLDKGKGKRALLQISVEELYEIKNALLYFRLHKIPKGKKSIRNLDTHLQDLLPNIILNFIEE